MQTIVRGTRDNFSRSGRTRLSYNNYSLVAEGKKLWNTKFSFLRQILRTAFTFLPYIENALFVWTQGQGQSVKTLLWYLPFRVTDTLCRQVVENRGAFKAYMPLTQCILTRTQNEDIQALEWM